MDLLELITVYLILYVAGQGLHTVVLLLNSIFMRKAFFISRYVYFGEVKVMMARSNGRADGFSILACSGVKIFTCNNVINHIIK